VLGHGRRTGRPVARVLRTALEGPTCRGARSSDEETSSQTTLHIRTVTASGCFCDIKSHAQKFCSEPIS
jgi:hypothetical protein